MARPDTWMPMYWRDFWADTAQLNEQEGWAYLNLIGAYWTNGGPIENDDARLERMARCSSKAWKASRSTVLAFFSEQEGRLHHKRIDRELEKAAKVFKSRSDWMQSLNEKRRQSMSGSMKQSMGRQPQPHLSEDRKGAQARFSNREGSGEFQPATTNGERIQWEARCKRFVETGFWMKDQWGPKPGSPGCKAPANVVEAFKSPLKTPEVPR